MNVSTQKHAHTHASREKQRDKGVGTTGTSFPPNTEEQDTHVPPQRNITTIIFKSMGVANEDNATGMEVAIAQPWGWEGEAPSLSAEQTALLDLTLAEVRANPLCSDAVAVAQGGRSAVWRYLEAAQWREEPTRGKRVSAYFIETLEWRAAGDVDTLLERGLTFEAEAASGKLFVRGSSLLGRPLIWLHAGREISGLEPEANIRFLVYTVVSASGRPSACVRFVRKRAECSCFRFLPIHTCTQHQRTTRTRHNGALITSHATQSKAADYRILPFFDEKHIACINI